MTASTDEVLGKIKGVHLCQHSQWSMAQTKCWPGIGAGDSTLFQC